MRYFILLPVLLLFSALGNAQTVPGTTVLAPGDYKHVNINSSDNADFTKGVILLHEVYDNADIHNNYAIGTLTARRGSAGTVNRINVAQINSSSAYRTLSADLRTSDDHSGWRLVTCRYAGKKYLALEVPYSAPHHNHGFKFSGWTVSTAENMKYVPYERNGQAINTGLLTDRQNYNANLNTTHYVANFNVMGKVGIGTSAPKEELSVNGNIRAKEIKVEGGNWPDYVFEEGYELPNPGQLEAYIRTNKHLPGIPDRHQVAAEGIGLGEMNRLLLEKVEELTLLLLELNSRVEKLEISIN